MPEFNCFRCSLLWGFPIKNFWDKTQFDEHIIVWNGFKVDCCLGAPPGIPNHQPKPLPLVTISWVRKKNNIYYDQLVMWGWPSLVCSWPQKKKMWVFPKIVVSQNNHCFARSISINNNLLNWAQIHSPHIYLLLKPHTHTHTHICSRCPIHLHNTDFAFEESYAVRVLILWNPRHLAWAVAVLDFKDPRPWGSTGKEGILKRLICPMMKNK